MADFLDPDEDAGLLATLISLERYVDGTERDEATTAMLRRRQGGGPDD
jgi:hypothetical protein